MIKLDNVSVRYGEGPLILESAHMHLKPGGFYWVTGPSGAGKSTLLRLLTLSVPPSSGRLEIFGQRTDRLTGRAKALLRKKIGIIFQDVLLLDYLTVFENIALPLHILGQRPADYKEDVVDLLQWVGLGDKVWAYPPTLSGGEKQRVAIARAAIGKPQLFVADEPTSSVDPQMARRLLRLFVELNKLGTGAVIATHDEQLMKQYSANRIELRDRHLIWS